MRKPYLTAAKTSLGQACNQKGDQMKAYIVRWTKANVDLQTMVNTLEDAERLKKSFEKMGFKVTTTSLQTSAII